MDILFSRELRTPDQWESDSQWVARMNILASGGFTPLKAHLGYRIDRYTSLDYQTQPWQISLHKLDRESNTVVYVANDMTLLKGFRLKCQEFQEI